MLNFDEIKELLELVAEKGLDGLEIERAGFRLSINGKAPTANAAPAAPVSGGVTAVETVAEAPPTAPSAASNGAQEAATDAGASGMPAGAHIVSSPIVGTFYSAPSPDADPFVQPGDRVRKGQVLCIVEAMKLMNEIESDADGVVVEIYPSNGQPVEFGERLFAIQPA